MKMYLIGLLIILAGQIQASHWMWGESIGAQNMERIWDLCSDADNNAFVAGEFVDSLRIGGQSYSGLGLSDTFVAKYSALGELIWCNTLVSENENCALGVSTDQFGNSYAGGYFVGTMYCQGESVISNGLWDAWVAKFDPLGDLQWLRSFGGPLNDIIHGLVVNADGQVFAGGWFADSITLDSAHTLQSYGGSDVLVLSLNAEGDLLWAHQGGTEGVEYGYKISCDDAGNCFVTGSAGMNSNFDGLILNGHGMYVAKYNSLGAIQWLLPSLNAQVISIATQRQAGENQRGAVAGRLTGSGTIGDFAFSTFMDSSDYYWAEFDAQNGVWLNLQVQGGAGDDRGRDVNFGSTGDLPLMVVGTITETATFLNTQLDSAGADDIVLWHQDFGIMQVGGEFSEIPYAITQMPNGTILIAGWHWGSLNVEGLQIDSGSEYNQNAFLAACWPFVDNHELVEHPPQLSCYPNPFKGEITLQSPGKTMLNLCIYNLKGQKIRNLTASDQRNFCWDGKDEAGRFQAPGLYLYRLGTHRGKIVKL